MIVALTQTFALLYAVYRAMLFQSASFTVLVAVLLLSNPFCCSADNVYCVTPTLSANTSCSYESCPPDSTHCTTLSEYAKETELYFTSTPQ